MMVESGTTNSAPFPLSGNFRFLDLFLGNCLILR
jgi:hypothetical protein